MPQIVLLVGTRKGCFVLESDADRTRLERPRAVLRRLADLQRGARPDVRRALRRGRQRMARRRRLAQQRPRRDVDAVERGLRRTPTPTLKLSKITGLTAAHGRRARRHGGGRHLREHGRRRDLVAAQHPRRPARPRRLERPRQAAAGAPRAACDPARTPTSASHFWAVIQGYGIFETTDDGASWTPRNRGLRADWPLEDPEVGYCVHKLVMSPVDREPHVPAEPLRHAPQRRRRALVVGDHRGASDRLRLRRRRPSRTTARAST